MTSSESAFSDPALVDDYAERAAQMVPAYRDVHRMAAVLLGEHAPPDADVLVLGAGGGMETTALALAHPGWTFDAVDPSRAMLDLAARTLGPLAARVRMHQGYVDDAPAGPFDAATSLLTLHFVPPDERRRTVAEVRRRLAPGAPFVVMHLCFPQRAEAERESWLSRHRAYLIAAGVDPADAERARTAIASSVEALTPDEDFAILRDAGLRDVTEFFSAFTFRGWVGYA